MGRCMTPLNLVKLRDIIERYHTISDICGHFGALVANMSVCTELADQCVKLGYVEILVQCLYEGHLKTAEAVKHVVAALHNLSDIENFTEKLCLCNGIEILRATQAKYADGEISDFVDGVFDLGALPTSAMTSLHIASVCCDIGVVISLLHEPKTDTNILDKNGKSACDLAMEYALGEIVELLVATGAKFSEDVLHSLSPVDRKEMTRFVKRGKSHYFRSRRAMSSLITQNTNLVKDMAALVTESLPGIDLLLVLQ